MLSNSEKEKYADEKNLLVYKIAGIDISFNNSGDNEILVFDSLYNYKANDVVAKQAEQVKILRNTIRQNAINSRKKIKIVTFVKDIFSVNVSLFFKDFAYWMYQYSCTVTEDQRVHSTTALAFTVFDKLFHHEYALHWFQKELEVFTGINVFNFSFDNEKDWAVIQQDKYEILIVKAESAAIASIINEFAETSVSVVQGKPVTWYKEIKEDFDAHYKPSQAYLENLYASQYMQHFYNKNEIANFFTKAIKQ